MRLRKMIVNILACFCFVFGVSGYFYTASNHLSQNIEKFYTPLSLNGFIGMAVDDEKNIYIGCSETSTIQVYNSKGDFSYGLVVPSGWNNSFTFGMVDNDIHIFTPRSGTGKHFVVDKSGEVVSENNLQNETTEDYNVSNTKEYVVEQNVFYQYNSWGKINILNAEKEIVETIDLQTPVWPFSLFAYGLFAIIGIVTLFVNNDLIDKMSSDSDNDQNHKYSLETLYKNRNVLK